MVYAAEEEGGINKARLRDHDSKDEWREWFIFDNATQTIRLAIDHDLVLTHTKATKISKGLSLVLRGWDKRHDNRIKMLSDNTFRNKQHSDFCMEISEG